MGMNGRSLIDKIKLTFIGLTATTIHHCPSACSTDQFRVWPEFGPGGGAYTRSDTRNINQAVNVSSTDVFRHLDADFHSPSQEIQVNEIDNLRSMICRRIHSTGTNPAMAQPDNDQGSFVEDFLNHIPEELIEQRNNSFNCLSSLVAATEASMRFSAVLPMGRCAIASRSQPVPCGNSNSNSNDITNITSVENVGLVDGSMIVERAMSQGG